MSQRTVLLLQQCGDGPICHVGAVRHIEIVSKEKDVEFLIVHQDKNHTVQVTGNGLHEVILPSGPIRAIRISGTKPATVYAWS